MQKLLNMINAMENIPRPKYLYKILRYKGNGVIKVLTGQRRVGKSCILNSVEEKLRQSSPTATFMRINLEDFDKVIRSLCLDARNDIYITGSNSSI